MTRETAVLIERWAGAIVNTLRQRDSMASYSLNEEHDGAIICVVYVPPPKASA